MRPQYGMTVSLHARMRHRHRAVRSLFCYRCPLLLLLLLLLLCSQLCALAIPGRPPKTDFQWFSYVPRGADAPQLFFNFWEMHIIFWNGGSIYYAPMENSKLQPAEYTVSLILFVSFLCPFYSGICYSYYTKSTNINVEWYHLDRILSKEIVVQQQKKNDT